jgi:hypothetical protein
MLSGINFNSSGKGKSNHRFFEEIKDSCDKELNEHGFKTETYLLHGGVGVKILELDHPPFTEISQLPIKEFDFNYIGTANLEGLDEHRKLNGIIFSRSSLYSFSQLPPIGLKKVYADSTSAEDFESLKSQRITELSIRKTKISSIDFLNNSQIEKLFLSHTQIGDEQLQKLSSKSLRVIDLLKCPISSVFPLRKLPIEDLNISGTEVDDISPLKDCPIKKLDMRVTKVSDLSPLSHCPIETLHLPGSQITSLESLRNCPITDLNIAGLEIEDLSPLFSLPLESLSISRETLRDQDVSILKQLNLKILHSPGDSIQQTPEEFFEKITDSTD